MKSNIRRLVVLAFVFAVMILCIAVYFLGSNDDSGDATVPPSFVLMPGASLRFDNGEISLRFETRILTEELRSLGDDVTVGTVILPTDLKTGRLTVDTPNVMNLSTTVPNGKHLVEEGEYTVFRAAVTSIKPVNYTRFFSAVSYLKIGEKYYYTPYSDAENSRSLWQLAAEAWAGEHNGNETVKALLDQVVVLNGSMELSRTVKGYTSPYNASYKDGVLRVTAKDGTLVDGDITTIMLDYDHKAYTKGWTVSNNALTANFDAHLSVVENFDLMSRDPGAGFETERFSVEFAVDPPRGLEPDGGDNHYEVTDSSVAANDGSLTYIKGNVFDTSYPVFSLKGDVASALGEENDTLTVSLSLRMVSGYRHVPPMTFKLMSDTEHSIVLASTFETTLAHGPANDQTREIATLTSDVWLDLTFRIDLVNAKMQTYCNGALQTTVLLDLPSGYDSLLDWAKEHLTENAFSATAGTMNYFRPNAIRFDSMSWGVSKSN